MNNHGVLFNVSAGHQIGTGHLLRCLNIAQHLIGRTRVFFGIEGDQATLSFAEERKLEVLPPTKTLELRPRVVVVDRLEVEPSSLVYFKEKGAKIILLDTLSGWEVADVLINALPHPPYQQRPPKRLKVFEGPSYICLGEDIVRTHQRSRSTREVVSKILVTCGGSDPYGLTLKLARAVVRLPDPPTATFILGRIFKDREELDKIIEEMGYTIIQDTPSLVPFMMEADIALTSFGLTVYEAASLGLPAIMLPPTPDHAQRADIFAKHGMAINLGLNDGVSLEKITGEIEGLRSNLGLRRQMSEAGRNLVDGEGTNRVARIILDLLSR